MTEVSVKRGEELNGLGVMLKEILDKNLRDPRKYDSVRKLNARVVIKETTSGVAVTLSFKAGDVEIQNDAVEKPTAYMEAGFENLAYISSGQLNPVKAMLTGKLRSRGNLTALLKISKVIVLK